MDLSPTPRVCQTLAGCQAGASRRLRKFPPEINVPDSVLHGLREEFHLRLPRPPQARTFSYGCCDSEKTQITEDVCQTAVSDSEVNKFLISICLMPRHHYSSPAFTATLLFFLSFPKAFLSCFFDFLTCDLHHTPSLLFLITC